LICNAQGGQPPRERFRNNCLLPALKSAKVNLLSHSIPGLHASVYSVEGSLLPIFLPKLIELYRTIVFSSRKDLLSHSHFSRLNVEFPNGTLIAFGFGMKMPLQQKFKPDGAAVTQYSRLFEAEQSVQGYYFAVGCQSSRGPGTVSLPRRSFNSSRLVSPVNRHSSPRNYMTFSSFTASALHSAASPQFAVDVKVLHLLRFNYLSVVSQFTCSVPRGCSEVKSSSSTRSLIALDSDHSLL
jgi:hypothetical protein